ncbi:NAD(P)-dependent oxidoreductase [Pendulispora albinea]|uniref:NAD(P)-dependent oxidoreductase n=1 Tax=Pendulispora albinea TaxID=2741071 RepID=A0ABZ2LSF4_9BACT
MSTSARAQNPVLIVGGSGVVGSLSAKILRQLHPDLPITLAGRDPNKAAAVAREVGGADGVAVDLGRADLGLPEGRAFSAIVMFTKDETLHAMRYAQAKGTPYLGLSSALFEMGPEVSAFVHAPKGAPILMDSSWLAGTAILPTLQFARAFRSIDAIAIGAVLDERDMGGPSAYADYDRIMRAARTAMILKNGKWIWAGDDGTRRFTRVDGTEVEGQAYHAMDTVGLAAATGAANVRLDIHLGESSSRGRGEPFSTEVIVEIEGRTNDGAAARVRHELVHPEGQAPMTAVGVAVGVERLLGLAGGDPVAPGLHLPETLIEPDYMVKRLKEFGARIGRA